VDNLTANTASSVSGVLNDLDLTLHENETVFYPNGLTQPDTMNNAERVIIDIPTNGATYSIRVFGSNLLDDQVMQGALCAYRRYHLFAHTLEKRSLFVSSF
jgi:hypothetical protein